MVMAEIYGHDSDCYFMFHIAEETNLEKRVVRLAVRALARKGLAEYVRGLFSMQTDMIAGSGYRATKEGYDLVKNDSEFKGDNDD